MANSVTQNEIYRRWYLKLKANPKRYKARLEKTRAWNRKYRAERSTTYLKQVERKRNKRRDNPFPHREHNRQYYQVVKSDPVAYKAMLQKSRARYRELQDRLKKSPEQYRRWLNARMVYNRYRRIIEKERATKGAQRESNRLYIA